MPSAYMTERLNFSSSASVGIRLGVWRLPSAYMTERLNFSSLASSNVGVLRL